VKSFDLNRAPSESAATPAPGVRAAVLLDQEQAKMRRIELDAGGAIPPCQMAEDVVFVVLRGLVVITAGADEEAVAAPGAVYVPGGATTRSLRATEPSLVLAVLCRDARQNAIGQDESAGDA
jgi:quercetin dioxygenase-like cupin family protein